MNLKPCCQAMADNYAHKDVAWRAEIAAARLDAARKVRDWIVTTTGMVALNDLGDEQIARIVAPKEGE